MSEKAVLILSDNLQPGLKANISMVLGMSLSNAHPQLVGRQIKSNDEFIFSGITRLPIPVLEATSAVIKDIAIKANNLECWTASFTDVALTSNNYEQYAELTGKSSMNDFTFCAVVMFGDKRLVNRLVGNLPLVK